MWPDMQSKMALDATKNELWIRKSGKEDFIWAVSANFLEHLSVCLGSNPPNMARLRDIVMRGTTSNKKKHHDNQGQNK